MIAKRTLKKPHVKDSFAGLARYIAAAKESGEKLDRLWIVNCHAGETIGDLDLAIAEGEAVRGQRPEVDDKTYHLIVSFRPGERDRLSARDLKDIEAAYAGALGFTDHQRVAGTHVDTDHFHMHVAYNTVHPETLKVHTPYRDFFTLAACSRRLERHYGLVVDPGMEKRRGNGPGAAARDHEAHTWEPSFQSHVMAHEQPILERLAAARDWPAVHALLADYDIAIAPHANGFTLLGPGGQRMKASAVHRSCGKKQLEARFGPFQPDRAAGRAKTAEQRPDASPTTKTPANGEDTDGRPESSQDTSKDAGAHPSPQRPDRGLRPDAESTHRREDRPRRPAGHPYRRKPHLLNPALERLWRLTAGPRQGKRPGLAGLARRSWKAVLIAHAWSDPMAALMLLYYQEMLSLLAGGQEMLSLLAGGPTGRQRGRPLPRIAAPMIDHWRRCGGAPPWEGEDARGFDREWPTEPRQPPAGRWDSAAASSFADPLSSPALAARSYSDEHGNRLLPFCTIDGAIEALSVIAPNGARTAIGNPHRPGLVHIVNGDGQPFGDGPAIVASDPATAWRLHHATALPVIVTADSGRQQTLARLTRRFPALRPLTRPPAHAKTVARDPGRRR